MDWYAWLCKAGLDPDLAYEYALLFERNELGAADVRHLNHDFLASMGVSVAKHRLEILKLARKDAGADSSSASYARLVRKAGKCLARCVRRLAHRGVGGGRGSSVTVVPRICNGDDVRVGAVQRRSVKKMVLMITDGTGTRGGRFPASQKARLMFHDCYEDDEEENGGEDGEEEPCSDGAGGGEIKWDSMFQDLKPT